jgi:D-alanyl-D-alanine carboxypeptidase
MKRLFSNFQFLNFFLASVAVVILFGLSHNPDSSNLYLSSEGTQPMTQEDHDFNENLKKQLEKYYQNMPEGDLSDHTITQSDRTSPWDENILDNNLSNHDNQKVAEALEEKMWTQFRQQMEEIEQTHRTPPVPVKITQQRTLPPPNYKSFINSRLPKSLQEKTSFGHFPFDLNSPERLVEVEKYYGRQEYLDREVADVFTQMKADAQKNGVELVLISGFRGMENQTLLFQKQIELKGSQQAAAQVSAPPGYSEHHTGYALDIGDGKQPSLDLKIEFESSDAYKWLLGNGYKYGFELSFPPNNIQGISFEPWHWRFITSNRAKEIFRTARQVSHN